MFLQFKIFSKSNVLNILLILLACINLHPNPAIAANSKVAKGTVVKNTVEKSENVTFQSFEFKGLTVLNPADLNEILQPYKNINLPDKKSAIANIIALVNLELIKAGYLFSSVTDHKTVNQKLILAITEGSIKEVVIRPELLEIKYLKEYIERLKANSPFNANHAKKDIALIKRLLGSNVKIIPITINPKEVKDGKTFDLFIADHKKVSGIFDIDNSNKSFYNTNNNDIESSLNAQEGGYFTLGSLYTKIANPYNMPGHLATYVASSGDRKDNTFFMDYTHQINSQGTQVKAGVGVNRFKFSKKEKEYFNANLGVNHPLILGEQHALELTAKTIFYTTTKKSINFKSAFQTKDYIDSDLLDPKNYNNNLTVQKLVFGPSYKFVSFLETKHYYSLFWHKGKGSQKYKNAKSVNENTNFNFNKFDFSGSITLPLPKDFDLNFKINAQKANKDLPVEEYFTAGGVPIGRGFKPNEIGGYQGISGSIELSHLNVVRHPFLNGIREYIYYDRAKNKRMLTDTKFKTFIDNQSLSSFGVGLDFHLANDMVVKFALNKPISLKTYEDKTFNKKVKLFAGLEYYFAF